MTTFLKVLTSRYVLWLLLYLPFAGILMSYRSGRLYYGEVIHLSGEWSVRLMMLAMAATPLLLVFPGRAIPRWLIRNRRYLGVASFAYAALHTAVYLNKTALLADVWNDAVLPEYLSGWLAMIVFTLLAATSNDASVSRLKRAWKSLHRLVYAAAALSFAHWVLVAFDPVPAILHLGLLAGLEGYRLWRLHQIRRSPV